MSLMTESCTLHLRGELLGHDSWNEPIYSEPEDVESDCWVEPNTSTEDMDLAHRDIYSYRAFLPLDQPVRRIDQITWDGERFNIVGRWLKQPSGFELDGYYQGILERVEG